MVCIFFKANGRVTMTILEDGQNMNRDTYIGNCLVPLSNEMRVQKPVYGTTKMIFYHDNARPHIQKRVTDYLDEEGYTLMRQPAYSSDFAPADFWLFECIKRQLSDHLTSDSLFNQIQEILNRIPKRDWSRAFEKWQERMQLIIHNSLRRLF